MTVSRMVKKLESIAEVLIVMLVLQVVVAKFLLTISNLAGTAGLTAEATVTDIVVLDLGKVSTQSDLETIVELPLQ